MMVALAVPATWGVVQSAPAAAEATCDGTGPQRPAEVRGDAWSGTVTDISHVATDRTSGNETWVIRLDVDRVYAVRDAPRAPRSETPEVGRALQLRFTDTCRPTDLTMSVGGRYLVSWSAALPFDETEIGDVAVWSLADQQAMFSRDLYPITGPVNPRLATADTVGEVVALVAPGSMPATDSPPTANSGIDDLHSLTVELLLLLLASGTGIFAFRRLGQQRNDA